MSKIFKGDEIVFGLYGGKLNNGEFVLQCLIGTLFSIGGIYFMTAGHVLEQPKAYDQITIGVRNKSKKSSHSFAGVGGFEIFENIDIGIIRCLVNKYQPLRVPKWTSEKHASLSDVSTFGFPFGLKLEEGRTGEVYLRSLKGYIVCSYQLKIPYSEKVKCYELSMNCPRGISGAPLLSSEKPGCLIGVVVGNANSEIEVSNEVETEKDGNSKVVYRKTEIVRYGIAIQSCEILKLDSNLLGKKIRDHLIEYKLLD